MIIHNCEQKTDEWFNLKSGKFSASGFSKLIGNKSLKGYQDQIYKVAYEKLTGQRIETYTNKAMQDGIEDEPLARRSYEKETNQLVDEVGFIELNEWVGVSPDGLINNDGMIEIKCPQWNTQIDYLIKNKLPSEYKYQVQGQLWVAEREWNDFYSWHTDLPALKIRVYRDEKIIKELSERITEVIEETKNILNQLEKRYINGSTYFTR